MKITWWIFSVSVLCTYKLRRNLCGATLCSTSCLIVSNRTNIFTLDLQTSSINPVISGLTSAVAIDVHFSLGFIFWSDVEEGNIKRLHIDTGTKTTIISNIGVCAGLAVEWRTSLLFWTDKAYNTISVSDLDGNNKHAIISSHLYQPIGIALDPDNNFIFWTNWGVGAKIERATLKGGQRKPIVATNVFLPNGLDLDKGNRRIFWVDAGFNGVESTDYNGGNRKLLYRASALHLFGVGLVPPFLFLTDRNTKREVYKLDALTGDLLRTYSINGGQPMGVVVYDGFRQPSASSPCSLNNGGCSHFCVPKNSSYECVCPTGLALKQNGKACEEKVNNFILFTDANAKSLKIISLDVSYLETKTLVQFKPDSRPIALDFDPVEDRVYWSDVLHGLIASAFRNASSVKILYICNVVTPDGLAIDHVGRNIYWTDTGTNTIEVGRLDGKKRKALFRDGLDEPRAIVLDERNGMMYWTDWGFAPKIEKAEMDGSARRSIVIKDIFMPNGLTIDHPTKRLFWADAQLNTVEMSDLNGGNRESILSLPIDIHPFGLALYSNVLYWTDWSGRSILLYNLSSNELKVGIPDLQELMGIHVFDSSLMYSGSHACTQNNGFCSDLCLLKSGGYKCACPTGIALKSDGKNCNEDKLNEANSEKFMIFAGGGTLYNVALIEEVNPCDHLEIEVNISGPVAVDYDSFEGKIYWADVNLHQVARAFVNGSFVEVLAYTNVKLPKGLAVDYVGRNLYWTDAGTSKIEVARLDGSSRRSLITSDIESPGAILLDIAERKMFWSDCGSSPKIELCNMDGSARTVLVSSGLDQVNSLAIDFSKRLLYWCDVSLERIERVDLQGNNREVILDLSSDDDKPFGIALSDNVLYWSDVAKKKINKYNMTSFINETVVLGTVQSSGLRIHDDTNIFNGYTSCSHLNGGCSHLCLPNPFGHHCFCPEGVDLKPDDARTCQGVNRCPQLPALSNGNVQPCSNLPGHTCQFSCDGGYILSGSATRTCRDDGTWTGKKTECKASYDEMKSRSEYSSFHFKLAHAILAGMVFIILFTFIPFNDALNRHFQRVRPPPTEPNFSSGINTPEVLSSHDEQPFVVDAAGLNNWNENEITLSKSAALHLKYTTQAEGFFDSSGGVLSADPNSDVQIIIENGAIPNGNPQRLFFNVIFDETALLQGFPEENTLVSPVIECGPADINFLKPVEIILPHCLYLGWTKQRWISVYRTDPGCSNWKEIPRKSEKTDQSKAWYKVKQDSIHIKTMTFSLWSIFACRGPTKKRATVFASKPDPESNLICLRFYIYSDDKDSRRRVTMKEKESFPESRPAGEKPFKLYNNNKGITVKLADIEEGWEEQIYSCGEAHGCGFRSTDAYRFAVKPIEGRAVKDLSCIIKLEQDGADEPHEILLNPGFAHRKKLEPVKFQRQNSAEICVPEAICSSAAGSPTSSAPEDVGGENFGKNPKFRPDSKLLSLLLECDSYLNSVCTRLDTKMPGVGDYHTVCTYYDIDIYTVASVFEKHDGGPSRALIEHLAASRDQLTVAEFVSVLRKRANRGDVAKLLEDYDNQ